MDFTTPGYPAIGAVILGGGKNNAMSSMSYHSSGERLYVASEQSSKLHVIDCINGKTGQLPLRCERDRIHLVEKTHSVDAILYAGKGASTDPVGKRNAIGYWSIHDNKILRKFRGHSDRVMALSMCPADDTFLSSSSDRTVRLWTLQSAGCLAEMKLPPSTTINPSVAPNSPPLAVFDSTGLVFAMAASMSNYQGHNVHLYDARNYGAGAFVEFKVHVDDIQQKAMIQCGAHPDQAKYWSQSNLTSIQFNLAGNQILLGTDKGLSILLDGFEGTVLRVFTPAPTIVSSSASTNNNSNNTSMDSPAISCITADDKTLLTGHNDGTITCWSIESGVLLQRLEGHPGPIHCLMTNPKYAQFSSCGKDVALWSW